MNAEIVDISEKLNTDKFSEMLWPIDNRADIKPDETFAVRDGSAGTVKRGRLIRTGYDEKNEEWCFRMLCIDYGNMSNYSIENIYKISNERVRNLPARCFECCLAEVQPHMLESDSGTWSASANSVVREAFQGADREVTIEVRHWIRLLIRFVAEEMFFILLSRFIPWSMELHACISS